jgi:hypothetical protein
MSGAFQSKPETNLVTKFHFDFGVSLSQIRDLEGAPARLVRSKSTSVARQGVAYAWRHKSRQAPAPLLAESASELMNTPNVRGNICHFEILEGVSRNYSAPTADTPEIHRLPRHLT